MAIFSEPITPLPDEPAYGSKPFILEGEKEGQDWCKFATDWRSLPDTHEVYCEHSIIKRGSQELRQVRIGVRRKLTETPAPDDGLDKMSMADLRTKAPQVGVNAGTLNKTQLIEAIRKTNKEPVPA